MTVSTEFRKIVENIFLCNFVSEFYVYASEVANRSWVQIIIVLILPFSCTMTPNSPNERTHLEPTNARTIYPKPRLGFHNPICPRIWIFRHRRTTSSLSRYTPHLLTISTKKSYILSGLCASSAIPRGAKKGKKEKGKHSSRLSISVWSQFSKRFTKPRLAALFLSVGSMEWQGPEIWTLVYVYRHNVVCIQCNKR